MFVMILYIQSEEDLSKFQIILAISA